MAWKPYDKKKLLVDSHAPTISTAPAWLALTFIFIRIPAGEVDSLGPITNDWCIRSLSAPHEIISAPMPL